MCRVLDVGAQVPYDFFVVVKVNCKLLVKLGELNKRLTVIKLEEVLRHPALDVRKTGQDM